MTGSKITNEKLLTLNSIDELINDLEFKYKTHKATDYVDVVNQLLYAYDIKIKLLNSI